MKVAEMRSTNFISEQTSNEESVGVKETESNDEVLTQNQYGNTLRSRLQFREVTSFFMYFQVFSKMSLLFESVTSSHA